MSTVLPHRPSPFTVGEAGTEESMGVGESVRVERGTSDLVQGH